MKELALSIPGYTNIVAPLEIPQGEGTTNAIISLVINLLVVTGFVAALIYLLLAGIKWITSGGDKEKIESARKGITYSIIGLVIILLSFVIINLIGQILGVWQLEQFGLIRTEQNHKPNNP